MLRARNCRQCQVWARLCLQRDSRWAHSYPSEHRPPDHKVGGDAGQEAGECGRVVASIENERWCHIGVAEAADQITYLGGGDSRGISLWRDAADVGRRGPRIVCPAQLGYPLIGPAGHDRLPGRMCRCRIVEPVLRARLGITTGPRCVRRRRTPTANRLADAPPAGHASPGRRPHRGRAPCRGCRGSVGTQAPHPNAPRRSQSHKPHKPRSQEREG